MKFIKWLWWHLRGLLDPSENDLWTDMGDDYFRMRLD